LNIEEGVLQSLEAALNVKLDRAHVRSDSPLLGAVPEFDSMAVLALLTALEERFGFVVEDDDVDGATFATVGTVTDFVRAKLGT